MTLPTFPKEQERLLRLIAIFLGALLTIAMCWVLLMVQSILIPFCIALFLAYLVEPLQKVLIRFKIPTGLRVLMILLFTGLGLYLVGLLVFSSVKSLNQNLPHYEQRIVQILDQIAISLPISSEEIDEYLSNFKWSDQFEPGTIAQVLGTSFGKFSGFMGNLFLVLLYMVYLLFERESFFKRIYKSFPTEKAERIAGIVQQINHQIASYLEIKTMLSLATGSLVALILTLFGVDFALFWGILTFLLNFIPSIGSIVATIPPIVIALLQFENFWIPIGICVLLITVQMVIGNAVEPKVMGGKLGLSPLVVVLSLIFWGWLWGPTGMILSVPIVSAIRIICDNIEILKPISGFLAEKT